MNDLDKLLLLKAMSADNHNLIRHTIFSLITPTPKSVKSDLVDKINDDLVFVEAVALIEDHIVQTDPKYTNLNSMLLLALELLHSYMGDGDVINIHNDPRVNIGYISDTLYGNMTTSTRLRIDICGTDIYRYILPNGVIALATNGYISDSDMAGYSHIYRATGFNVLKYDNVASVIDYINNTHTTDTGKTCIIISEPVNGDADFDLISMSLETCFTSYHRKTLLESRIKNICTNATPGSVLVKTPLEFPRLRKYVESSGNKYTSKNIKDASIGYGDLRYIIEVYLSMPLSNMNSADEFVENKSVVPDRNVHGDVTYVDIHLI